MSANDETPYTLVPPALTRSATVPIRSTLNVGSSYKPTFSSSDSQLPAYKSRQPLTVEALPFKGQSWFWLSNVSFLVANGVIVGSLLFVVGAMMPFSSDFVGPKSEELVTFSYFIGGTYCAPRSPQPL